MHHQKFGSLWWSLGLFPNVWFSDFWVRRRNVLLWPLEGGCGHVACFGQSHTHHPPPDFQFKKKKITASHLGWVSVNVCLCNQGNLGPDGPSIKLSSQVNMRIKASLLTQCELWAAEIVCYPGLTQPALTHTTALPVQCTWLPSGGLGWALLCCWLGICPKERIWNADNTIYRKSFILFIMLLKHRNDLNVFNGVLIRIECLFFFFKPIFI